MVGVNPIYNGSISIPAEYLLNGISHQKHLLKLCKENLRLADAHTFTDLRTQRINMIGVKQNKTLSLLSLSIILLSILLFFKFIMLHESYSSKWLPAVGVSMFLIFLYIILSINLWEYMDHNFPFRADALMQHSFHSLIVLFIGTMIPLACNKLLFNNNPVFWHFLFLRILPGVLYCSLFVLGLYYGD